MSQPLDVLMSQLNFRDSRRVKYDTQNLLARVTSLVPKVGTLIQNTGVSLYVLDLQGTVPIFFSGVQYNIPVEIYVTEDYPRSPPQIYVRPTPNMVIKPNHSQVDTQGLVYLPYLHSWSPTSSTLSEMVTALCEVFGQDPPVYARTKQPQPLHDPSTSRVIQGSIVHSQSTGGSSSATYQQPRGAPSNYSQPLQGHTSAYPTGSTSSSGAVPVQGIVTSMHIPEYLKEMPPVAADPQRRSKELLVGDVTARLQESILITQTRLKDEIEKEFVVQQELVRAQAAASLSLAELQSVRERFTRELSSLQAKEERLDRWIAEKEADRAAGPEELASRLIPYDKLSEQLVSLQAEFLAIEDALYYLERALASKSNDSVNLETFLRETRKLARRQFLCKSHIRKIQGQIGSHFR